jgi:hypothetical protein
MSVCCECCVLLGRGLCNKLITRPEESYRLWCVVVCDLENLAQWEMSHQKETKPRNIRLLPVSIPITTAIHGRLFLSITLRRRWSWNSNTSYCPRLKGFTLYPYTMSRPSWAQGPAACEKVKALTLHWGAIDGLKSRVGFCHGSGSYLPFFHYGDPGYIPSKSIWVM